MKHEKEPNAPDLFGPTIREDRWQSLARSSAIDVSYNAGFLTDPEADRYLRAVEQLEFRQEEIRLYGRVHKVPRLTAAFGEAGSIVYEYSGIRSQADPFPAFLEQLRDKVQYSTDCCFNFVLINLYRDGHDRVGWHSDDEKTLGSTIDVASLSLGATRSFKLRCNSASKTQLSQRLCHGSLLLMKHPTQLHWQHCISQERRVKRPRYNLTFRNVLRTVES